MEQELRAQIDPARVPVHIAITMDGNGRWAEQHGEARIAGHLNGVQPIREVLTAATEVGVKYLTLYAFSTENWNRPKAEVDALMELLVTTLASEVEELDRNGVRLHTIGDTDSLPAGCRSALMKAMDRTAANGRITLTLALSYSARWDILRMVRSIATDIRAGRLDTFAVNEQLIDERLSTRGLPDPDLLIRTSGEHRISNFLLWEIAYSELWFTPVLWPDIRKQHLFQAIVDFQHRERRFGLTSDQPPAP
ncbi:MAG: isoprenyl transferase [Flavobacteriales bacterium]|nr:isoprenyl transferase [Flavobacteriales bacterium]MBP9079958.1 isoprenyl transferase [Flavobacteriales bacterium]